jgi:hypothetical protein
MQVRTITGWYLRNERWISSLALVGGFVFDTLTLKRVDLLFENVWVLLNLAIACIGILLINLYENKKARFSEKTASIIHFWLIMLIQFSFGALMSTFMVFYIRSGTLSASWPFLALLAIIYISNELLKHHYTRLVFQVSVLYISLYTFAIFILPVLLHKMGSGIFILSGIASLAILILFLLCLRLVSRERFRQSKKLLVLTIGGITLLINVLYFTNLIPPIPLALKNTDVYHSIVRHTDGNYTVTGEEQGFWGYFTSYKTFHIVSGEPVYAFSSIFSPTGLSTDIIHEWQRYDESTKKWLTRNETRLSIVGGRDGGFRTYSTRIIDESGKWRVNVKTPQGQLMGRIKFKIENVEEAPILFTSSV